MPDDWSLRLTANARFTTNYDFTIGAGGELKNDRQKGFTEVDATLSLLSPNDTTEISLFGNNLFGVHYAAFRNTAGYGTFISPSVPRIYGIRVGRKF